MTKKYMNKGFGIIGLIITLAIIALMVWGAYSYNGAGNSQNQIQQSQDQIQSAKDAAELQSQYNQQLQMESLSPTPINYGSVRDKTNTLK